ncbi:Carboxypeptidase regulatory-like domain-containing protein [Granulicella rosea]|uniref:Carboxypeptidase regulatory-like domain-containing protein n=1 Tax=Granulicella rosea TaxID=474952 RepID=A0A239DUX5_9BACT|nr:carboxypeptidase-like regulatory domain-containing protein [Granulicella rosea]SNS35758.1 Carboxypeptidase regulatory-like domain-containing protein [Granulicella rosea]
MNSFSPGRERKLSNVLQLLAPLAVCLSAGAQVGSSTITGTVQDTTGAAIPNAEVVLLDTANQTTQTQTTNAAGFFTFVNLPASGFQVTINAAGFKSIRRTGIALHINDQLNLPALKLSIAENSASITVSTEEQIAPTTSGEQSYTLTSEQIEKLNIQGRSAIELLGLVPGAANAGNFNSNSYSAPVAGFTQNSSAFSVNGNRFDQVQIVSDGAPVTDVQTAGASAVTPNVDMIQESKIQTAAYSSDQPNGPVVVQTETKSGGKQFHGEVYLTTRNHALNTTDWRVKSLGLQKPDDSFYYPGGNIGGPVFLPGTSFNRNRDKLFFFFGFEKSIQNVQDPLIDIREAIVPTAAMRTGDFSNSAYLASLGKLDYYQGVAPCASGYNQTYCSSPGVLKSSAIDPGGKILLNLLPLPNADPSVFGGYNYIKSYLKSEPRDQETGRVDYNLTAKNHLSARYNHEGESVPFPYGLYNNFTLTPYPAPVSSDNHSNSITSRLSTTLPASFTNEVTFTLTRLVLGTNFTNTSAVSRTALGYPYGNIYNTGSDVVPNFSFSQSAHAGSLYVRGGDLPGYSTVEQTLVAGDQISKILRSHILKAGVYYERDSFNKRTTGQDNGSVTTSYYNYDKGTGNPFADLLVGAINSYSQSSANFMAQMLLPRFDFFVEDLWQANPRLTVNYGLRIDHIARWYDVNGRNVIFDPSLYNASGAVGNTSGLTNHMTNPNVTLSGSPSLGFQIAPSAGFAYDLRGDGKTVVRGGVGTNFYSDPGQNAFSAVQAPPNETFTSLYADTTLSQASSLPASSQYPTVYGIASQHDTRTPVTYSYNLAVAQELPERIHFQAAYTGNSSHNLAGYTAQNVVPEGCELPGGAGQAIGYAPGTYNDQLCRPYQNLGALSTVVHNLSSYFNSLQVTASRQTGFFNFWATYTYGKTLAYNCEDPFNMRRCYNPVPFDQSQAVNVSYLIKLPPVSKNHLGNHKVVNGILDGWEISGIEQVASGSPIGISANPQGNTYDGIHNRTINFYGVSDAANNYSAPNFDSRTITGTPDEAAAPTLICDPRKNLKSGQYFNAACFQAPAIGTSSTSPQIGTYRLPYIHGPRFHSDEIGLFKTFKLRDAQRFELRAQSFNFLNHPNYAFIQYDNDLYLEYDKAGTGLPTSSNNPGFAEQKLGSRSIQFSAKYYF